MIEASSAVTLGTREMPRAIQFYRALGFEVLHGEEQSSFTSFRAGMSYLNLVAQPTERRWSWWGRVIFYVADAVAVMTRVGWPLRHASPKKWLGSRTPTTASLPRSEITVSLILPLWM